MNLRGRGPYRASIQRDRRTGAPPDWRTLDVRCHCRSQTQAEWIAHEILMMLDQLQLVIEDEDDRC